MNKEHLEKRYEKNEIWITGFRYSWRKMEAITEDRTE